MICKSAEQRNNLIMYLKNKGVYAVFHYLSLHKSDYYNDKHDGRNLPNSDRYIERLVRLPLFYNLKQLELNAIIESIKILNTNVFKFK